MNDIIRLLEEDINNYNKELKELKERFVFIIKDKDNPLEERWEIFKKAPSAFKEQEHYIVEFKCLEKGSRFSWYDVFDYNRNETIDLIDIIDQLETDLIPSYKEGCEYAVCKFGKNSFILDPEFINNFKEEILQKNLESFIYDW